MLKKLLIATAIVLSFTNMANAQNMTKKDSVFQAEYDFDQKDYKKCLEQIKGYTAREYVSCLNTEIKKQNTAIEEYYKRLLAFPEFDKWNNGNGLFRGNVKDMNDQYVAYRERLCSMYGMGLYSLYGDLEHGRKECMMEMNDQLLRRLERIYNSSQADFGPDSYNGETYPGNK
jgi:hypothetical protein